MRSIKLLLLTTILATSLQLVSQVNVDDEARILRIGKSGNRKWIPILKAAAKEQSETPTVTAALAKLGDKPAQQKLACEWRTTSSYGLMLELVNERSAYIGGQFAVLLWEDVLKSSEESFLRFNDPSSGDLIMGHSPYTLAIRHLSKRFPNGPGAPATSDDSGEYRDQWLTWLNKNRRRIQELKPTSQVDFRTLQCSKS